MPPSSFHGEQEYLVTTENSDIWDIYNKESAAVDASMQDSANKSIDVLLVFTGLFSAVLTALIIFVYQSPNSAGQSSGPQDLGPPQENTSSPTPAGISGKKLKWVAALWVISLALSLADATFCILAKQWVRLTPIMSGSSRDRARQHQRRQNQFQAWHVMAVINVLPILLHTAILLFFIGLVVMLWGGSTSVTIMVLLAVVAVIGCYVGSIWLSLVYPDCPFQHPITEQLRYWRTHWDKRKDRDLEGAECNLPSLDIGSVAAAEDLPDPDDELDALALLWLLENCPKRSASYVAALKAIGGLPLQFTAFHTLRRKGVISLVLDEFRGCFAEDSFVESKWQVRDSRCAATYCRTWFKLSHGTSEEWPPALLPMLSSMPKSIEKAVILAGCAKHNGRDGRLMLLKDIRGLLSGGDRIVEGHLSGFRRITNQYWIANQHPLEELLGAFIQSSAPLYSPPLPRATVQKAGAPTLIRLLGLGKENLTSRIRQLLALSLCYITGYHERINFNKLRQESLFNHLCFLSLTIYAIAEIIEAGGDVYGFKETDMDEIVKRFCHMVSLAAKPDSSLASERQSIRTVAFRIFSRLYAPSASFCLGTKALQTLQNTVSRLRPNHDEVYQQLHLKDMSQGMPATIQWLQLIRHIFSISERDVVFAGKVIEYNVLNVINDITIHGSSSEAILDERLQIHYHHFTVGFDPYFFTLQQSCGSAQAMESIRKHILSPALSQLQKARDRKSRYPWSFDMSTECYPWSFDMSMECWDHDATSALDIILLFITCTHPDCDTIDDERWLNIYRLAFADLCSLLGSSCRPLPVYPESCAKPGSVYHLRDAVRQLLPILPDVVDQQCRMDMIFGAAKIQQRVVLSDRDLYCGLSLIKLRHARNFLSTDFTPGQIYNFLVQYGLVMVLADMHAIQGFVGDEESLYLDILAAVNNCLTHLLQSPALTPDIRKLISSPAHRDAFLRLHLEFWNRGWAPALESEVKREQLMLSMLDHCRMCPEYDEWKKIYNSLKSSMDTCRFQGHNSRSTEMKVDQQIEQLRCTIIWSKTITSDHY